MSLLTSLVSLGVALLALFWSWRALGITKEALEIIIQREEITDDTEA